MTPSRKCETKHQSGASGRLSCYNPRTRPLTHFKLPEAHNASPHPDCVYPHSGAGHLDSRARCVRFRARAPRTRSCRQSQTRRRADDRLRQLASPGLHQERASAGVLRPGIAADLRVQSRRGCALLPARWRTRPEAGDGFLGHRRSRRSELQRSRQRRPLRAGACRHRESAGARR